MAFKLGDNGQINVCVGGYWNTDSGKLLVDSKTKGRGNQCLGASRLDSTDHLAPRSILAQATTCLAKEIST